jgi:hypothetical protein
MPKSGLGVVRQTGKPLCLLINVGRPQVEIRRITAPA